MLTMRTDLAAEAHELWQENAGKTTRLRGVAARDERVRGMDVHRVEILDEEGAKALGKPCGTYLTMDVAPFRRHEAGSFDSVTAAMAELLRPLLPEEGCVLTAGIGNAAMTPDALGPLTLDHLLITRHLGKVLPDFRAAAAVGAGVLGTTGIEVAEWVRGVADRVKPSAVILVDALAARSLDRLCTTIQIADSGLVPGSGVGNHRMALNRETLGVPVVSIGVPTVVEARTLARDLLQGDAPEFSDREALFVTPDSIDAKVRDLAKLIGYGINRALQPELTVEDLAALLE